MKLSKEWLKEAIGWPLTLVSVPTGLLSVLFGILDGRNVLSGTGGTLSWSIPLGMTIGAVIYAIVHWSRTACSEIDVRPEHGPDFAYLKVKNKGSSACTLKGKMTSLSSDPTFLPVDMTWRKSTGVSKVELFGDDNEFLKVVEGVLDQQRAKTPLLSQSLTHLPAPNERVLRFPCTLAFSTYLPCGDSIKVEVVITGEPKLRKEFKQIYDIRLGDDGKIERCKEAVG